MACGPTCLRMIARHYGRHYNADTLGNMAGYNKAGVSMLGISETAEKIGFRTRGVQLTVNQLNTIPLPALLHWDQNHFVVLVSLSSGHRRKTHFHIADPAKGLVIYNIDEFNKHYISNNANGSSTGIALLLEPTPAFYAAEGERERKLNWGLILQYLRGSRGQITQVFVAMMIASVLQLIFPFLTQSIVDNGIMVQNLHYVIVVLLAQLMLTFSKTSIEFIRSRLLLRISNILNLQILSDFWIKLTHLPVAYFDVHHTGDTLQRIDDHRQIQNFLTGTALSTLFSIFNFIVYAIVLIIYNAQLFFVFCGGSILYFVWIWFFLKVRRKINYQTFYLSSRENNATLQLIQGMQEIRLNNAEKQKRWEWENIQAAVFNLNFKNLNYNQIQQAGAILINQIQNIAISFIVAKLVINGQLTLGAMLAVQYIIGQLSGPIGQWVGFVQSAQDAKISMERLNEIHQMDDEESMDKIYRDELPENKSISVEYLSFAYPGAGNEPVLKNLNLYIPEGKVTAIVGLSGSGKTTLLKLFLKIYENYTGDIRIGRKNPIGNASQKNVGTDLKYLSHKWWRSICGTVMQEGHIFNDTIAGNIVVNTEFLDFERLQSACQTANILSFIEALPNGFYTHLGTDGIGLSQGQKQRLLIARAIYKNPEYFFF